MNTLPINTSYERTFLNTAHKHFNKYPREWQLRVGGRIISDICTNIEIRQLCVQPTGSGKSLLFQIIAPFLKGVTLCLSPLLSLAADQVNKLVINTRGADSTIIALHMDESEHGDVTGIIPNIVHVCCKVLPIEFISCHEDESGRLLIAFGYIRATYALPS